MEKIGMEMQDQTFVFAGYCDIMMQSLFNDFQYLDHVKIVRKLLPFNAYINGLFCGLAMRLYKYKICQYGLYLLEKGYRPLEKAETGSGKTYLIFTNAASIGVSVPYLKSYLKRHKACIPVMLFMDPLDRYWAKYAKFLVDSVPQFQCFTFDPKDADAAGYEYTMNVYSCHEPEPGGEESDIYFSFFGPDRLEMVREMAENLGKKQVRCNFVYVGDIDEEKHVLEPVKHVYKRLTYSQILKDAAQANCLLEILRPGQTGSTLRYYEAICYNKKLLTTNKNVVNLPFYDPRYIKVFETPSEVDCEWVRRREKVDYHYDGRFSPVHFLEEIADSRKE